MKKLALGGMLATLLGTGVGMAAGMGVAGHASAWGLTQPETLNYRVSWGPLNMGKASFNYSPPPKVGEAYGITVTLNDSSSLINLNSRYTITGRHTPQAFTSARYHALQTENDYRADKTIVFDTAKKQITYTNNRDATDKTNPIKWAGAMRDVFSQLYALRVGGLGALQHGQQLPVMGTKHPFTLLQMAPIKMAASKNERPRYKVTLKSKKEDGSLGKETWVITLREETDASLTPVTVQAQTKFGTFTATLK